MTKRADTVKIEVSDPNCRGVTDSTGTRRYDKDAHGQIEVPKRVAREVLASGHRDTRLYRPVFAMSMAEVLERAAQRKKEASEHVGEA